MNSVSPAYKIKEIIMNKLYEEMKIDIGLEPISLATANKTGEYFSLADYRKAIIVGTCAVMAKTKTVKFEIYEATNASAGSAQLLASADATIVANVLVASVTITLATVLNTETITINDLLFSAHTNVESLPDRQFDISGDDTADALSLANCINDPTYGVPGVTATPNAAVLTLTSDVPGAVVFTAVSGDATFTVATLRAAVYIEVEALTLTATFTHIAVKCTTDATIICGAALLRGGQRKGITQKVGASASV